MANHETSYKKLPTMWNYLYPFQGDGSLENAEPRASQFLSTKSNPNGKKALYVHIPFCDTICTFCPFIRSTNYQDKLQPYVDALAKELAMVGNTEYIKGFELSSIYFGGGTPSVLTPAQIEQLGRAIHANFTLASDCEWSFEVEAKSATEDKLQAMHAVGVNRISFGVQTFDPEYRRIFNLTASYDEILRTRDLGEKYFKAHNMDLLYQLPGQTLERLEQDLYQAKQLATTSVDAYPLEYLVTSKGFLNMMKNGKIEMPPNADDKLALQQFAVNYLRDNGYDQTYVYTFTRKDARYNRFMFGETIYGRYEDEYIGCGLSASSSLSGLSHNNEVELDKYIAAVEAGRLPIRTAFEYHAKERALIFFPKVMRISQDYLNTLGLAPDYFEKLNRFEQQGLIARDGNDLVMTEEGKKFYLNMMIDLIPDDQLVYYNRYVERTQQDRQWFESNDLISLS
ncbi:coproporphyrinogen-III oxidase family protein [Tumebacillus flagellatus]|uniref:Heme chaperone HemW n=1 Tax=Tumebacillus flagellatus TaxID=1157490 RepID=A0A074LT55_9BACL|nr:coproporphyrinogen-III oxidase family protein [Tumebacillus flagellatus]KEO83675.1 hypothetical protein EL26_08455 [Tumebacillus flagellatus]